jgi:tetratricopeptide (TPR) repeat protein
MIRNLIPCAIAMMACAIGPIGGAGATDPMRTALVVNGNSIDSLTIANHYADLRSIPDISIIVLESVSPEMVVGVEQFRNQVLKPLISELDGRGLGIQTDTIAYSADFPTGINLQQDLAKIADLHKIFTPVGSPNGLTTLYQFVLSGNPEYVAPLSNYYARRDPARLFENPFLGSDRAIFQQAIDDAQAEDLQAAIEKLKTLLGKHPSQWPLRFRLAGLLNRVGQTDPSLETIAQLVEAGQAGRDLFDADEAFASLRDNAQYQRLIEKAIESTPNRYPAIPFSARQTYAINGIGLSDPTQGMRYLLSTVLAVTSGRGSTLTEAIESLGRAAAADGTGKPAEFFFSTSSDVRSQTRMPLIPVAANLLKEMGHETIVDNGRLPINRQRLMGAMLGSANYDWPAAMNNTLPGAILENLTSTSGVMHQRSDQTSMIELIRGGAAGTSGTVTEPYALQFKFPTPLIYPYYASGCTLAEAFYLAVESPYQLLIVGDPLCRPYGDQYREAFSLKVNETDDAYQVSVQFWRGLTAIANVEAIEIFLDGKLVNLIPPTGQLSVSKATLPAGEHQLTFAAISRHPLRIRSFESVGLSGENAACPKLTATVTERDHAAVIRADVETVGGTRVAVRHLGRRIAEADGGAASIEIPVSKTGYGPLRLIPEAFVEDAWVRGRPVVIDLELP